MKEYSSPPLIERKILFFRFLKVLSGSLVFDEKDKVISLSTLEEWPRLL